MGSALRVAVIATIVDFGGIERVLLTQLSHGTADVELVPILFTNSYARKGSFFKDLDALEVSYKTFELDSSRFKYWNPVRNIGETLRLLKGGEFDLIHTHGYRADLIGLIAARYCGLPIVATCHGFIRNDRNLSLYTRLDLLLLRFFNRVVSVSDRLGSELLEHGVNHSKLQVIRNAVPSNEKKGFLSARSETRRRLDIKDKEFVFGYVGRLSKEKGVAYLVEAAKRAEAEEYDWQILLVGDGPQRNSLEHAVRSNGLSRKVRFIGFQQDLSGWYPAMDAFVLPSLTEGTPMVLLEAMASGIPIVATSVGGVPAIISNGENGFLVPPADPMRLMAAMKMVADDGELRRRMAVNARLKVEKEYNVDTWIEKVNATYRSAVAM